MAEFRAIREEIKPSMLRRCNGRDYSQPCIYQITLALADRRSEALGRLEHETPWLKRSKNISSSEMKSGNNHNYFEKKLEK